MLPASQLRKESSAKSRDSLRSDYELVKKGTIDLLYREIEKHAARGKYEFKVFNYTTIFNENMRLERSHLKPSTFFTGFWVPSSQSHDLAPFRDAGLPPLMEAIARAFAPLGYLVQDVSDPNVSHARVLQVQIGGGGEAEGEV